MNKYNLLSRINHEVIVSKHQFVYKDAFNPDFEPDNKLITKIYFVDRNTTGKKIKVFSSYCTPTTNKNDLMTWHNYKWYNHITFNVPGRFFIEIEDNLLDELIIDYNVKNLNSLNRVLQIVVDVVFRHPE